MAEVTEEDIYSQQLKHHFQTKFLCADESFTEKTAAYQHKEEQQTVSESHCIRSVGGALEGNGELCHQRVALWNFN